MLDLAGVDHFDVIERLSEDSYVLTQVGRRAVPRRIRWAATSLWGGAGSEAFHRVWFLIPGDSEHDIKSMMAPQQ